MGLPIRIPAVLFTYNFPQRFAVRRVLLRLLVPRHPLCALFSLTFFSTSFFHFITLFYLLFKDLFSFGGAKRDRTADLLLAKQALSQLSYSPLSPLVGLNGLEPSTSRLSGVRSNRLSYKPFLIWQPPTLPCRPQHSTIGRLRLNRRVRDGYGCLP